MIQRAEQTEPVKVFGIGFRRSLEVKLVDPANQRFVGSNSAIGGLPKMTVGGDKARDDPFSMRIKHLVGSYASRRITCTHREDRSIVSNDKIARERIALLKSHRKDTGIPDQKLSRCGDKSGRNADDNREEGHQNENW